MKEMPASHAYRLLEPGPIVLVNDTVPSTAKRT